MSSAANPGAPAFRWAPRCGVTDLLVTSIPGPGAAPVIVWQIRVPENAAMGPPIIYGNAPRGGTVAVPPHMLVPGTTYGISVETTVGEDVVSASGNTRFVR